MHKGFSAFTFFERSADGRINNWKSTFVIVSTSSIGFLLPQIFLQLLVRCVFIISIFTLNQHLQRNIQAHEQLTDHGWNWIALVSVFLLNFFSLANLSSDKNIKHFWERSE